jgi:peptidoglycan/LPS O-acetylase OafA/YrhL
MGAMAAPPALAAERLLTLAQATSFSELAPYLAILALGFLVGAWGNSMRSPLAIAIGITLIMVAVALFVLGNTGSGGSGANPPPV